MKACKSCIKTVFSSKSLKTVDYFRKKPPADMLYRVSNTLLTAQKSSFSLRISTVNVIKAAVSCGFGHIY